MTKCTSYALVHEDGRVSYSEVVEGCEKDAFPKIEAVHGKFTAHKCDKAALPDREFRNAWKWNNGKVEVDLDKAKVIAAERKAAADIRAKAIADHKEQTRLVLADQKIAGARTPDELKAALRG